MNKKYFVVAGLFLMGITSSFGLRSHEGCKPKVQVAVVVVNDDGKILLGLRKGAHGAGTWALPSGLLIFGESWEDCACRKVLEKTGLVIDELDFLTVTNDIMEDEHKHFITIFMIAYSDSSEVQLLEPERCEVWQWFDMYDLPENLFLPLQHLIEEL